MHTFDDGTGSGTGFLERPLETGFLGGSLWVATAALLRGTMPLATGFGFDAVFAGRAIAERRVRGTVEEDEEEE